MEGFYDHHNSCLYLFHFSSLLLSYILFEHHLWTVISSLLFSVTLTLYSQANLLVFFFSLIICPVQSPFCFIREVQKFYFFPYSVQTVLITHSISGLYSLNSSLYPHNTKCQSNHSALIIVSKEIIIIRAQHVCAFICTYTGYIIDVAKRDYSSNYLPN